MAKYSRFLNLETPRQALKKGEGDGQAPKQGRFESLESQPVGEPPEDSTGKPSSQSSMNVSMNVSTEAPQISNVSQASLARFQPMEADETARFLPPPLSKLPDLELDERRGVYDAFIRCRQCGGDNNIHAPFCIQCAERLDTPEQAAFNVQFREKLLAGAEQSAGDFVAEGAAGGDGEVPPLSAPSAPAPAAWVDAMLAERVRRNSLDIESLLPNWLVPFWPRYDVIGAPEDGTFLPVERVLARVGALALGVLALYVLLFGHLRVVRVWIAGAIAWGAVSLWRWSRVRPRMWD